MVGGAGSIFLLSAAMKPLKSAIDSREKSEGWLQGKPYVLNPKDAVFFTREFLSTASGCPAGNGWRPAPIFSQARCGKACRSHSVACVHLRIWRLYESAGF
jgi:hypothetical protein